MTLQQLIDKFKSYCDCEEYTAASGKKCYRTSGTFDWFSLQCLNLGLQPKTIESGLHYEAHGNGFVLEYVEHDIILAID